MRLDVIKKNGFPQETCLVCGGDGCEHCDEGVFTQRVKPDWIPPAIPEGCRLVAYDDVDTWYLDVLDEDGESVQVVEWPFLSQLATSEHLKTLGFKIEW